MKDYEIKYSYMIGKFILNYCIYSRFIKINTTLLEHITSNRRCGVYSEKLK